MSELWVEDVEYHKVNLTTDFKIVNLACSEMFT